MQVNMGGSDQVHHHGILAGLGAATAGVLLVPVFVFAVWRHVASQVSAAVQVVVWAVAAAVVVAVAGGAAYAFLWIRHRALHPETLARSTVRAEVLPPSAREIPPAAPAELTAGPLWRPRAMYDPEPAERELP